MRYLILLLFGFCINLFSCAAKDNLYSDYENVEDKEAMKEFERLYQNLFNNTHIWEFKGFTPPQYENETGGQVKPFKIPEFERVEKGKKTKC